MNTEAVVEWHWPGALARFAEGHVALRVPAADLAQAMDRLVERFPDLKDVLLDRTGSLRGHLALLCDSRIESWENLRHRPIGEPIKVELLFVAGGG